MDEMEVIHGQKEPGFITGKPVGMGGSLGRTEATGYGVIYTVREALKLLGLPIDKMVASVQGFGNVAQFAVQLFTQYGGKVICVSCWDNVDQKTYSFRKMDGITYEELIGITDKFGTVDKVKAQSLGYEILPGDAWIEQDVDVLIPAAIENQVTADNVHKIAPRVKLIAEGANGPTTPEADKVLEERGIYCIPDFLCNAGGVTVSYFEMVQNACMYYWDEQEVYEKLDKKMTRAYHEVSDTSEKYKINMRKAAYVVAVERVVEAMKLRGWF